MELDKAN